MEIIFQKEIVPSDWDNNLYSGNEEAGLLQSSYWGRVLHQVDNAVPIYLQVKDKEGIVASMLLLHIIPWNRKKRRKNRSILARLRGIMNGYVFFLDGPVVFTRDENKAVEAIDMILSRIDNYCVSNKIRNAGSSSFAHTSKWALNNSIQDKFKQHGYNIDLWATYLVDLSVNEEELWGNMKYSARKSIKKCRRNAVKVREIKNLQELKSEFYGSYKRIEESYNRETNPEYVTEIQWTEDTQKNYRYLISENDSGEVTGTLGFYTFNGTATEIASAISREAYEQKLPVQDLLHWEAMLMAKGMGCNTFDLAGVNPNPSVSKESGIRRFKEKWGGKYIEYPRYEKKF